MILVGSSLLALACGGTEKEPARRAEIDLEEPTTPLVVEAWAI